MPQQRPAMPAHQQGPAHARKKPGGGRGTFSHPARRREIDRRQRGRLAAATAAPLLQLPPPARRDQQLNPVPLHQLMGGPDLACAQPLQAAAEHMAAWPCDAVQPAAQQAAAQMQAAAHMQAAARLQAVAQMQAAQQMPGGGLMPHLASQPAAPPLQLPAGMMHPMQQLPGICPGGTLQPLTPMQRLRIADLQRQQRLLELHGQEQAVRQQAVAQQLQLLQQELQHGGFAAHYLQGPPDYLQGPPQQMW